MELSPFKNQETDLLKNLRIMRLLKHVTLLILLFGFIPVNAQTVEQELNNIKSVYSKDKGVSFNISYNYYKDISSPKPYKQVAGEVKLVGDYYYSKLDNVETVKNQNYFIMVDSKYKRLMLDKPQENHQPPININSFGSGYKSSKLEQSGTDMKIILEYNNGQKIDKIEILYNPDNYFIQELTILYSEVEDELHNKFKPKIQVTYTKTQTGIKTTDKSFSEEPFFSYDGSKWFLKPTYTNYQFINNLAN